MYLQLHEQRPLQMYAVNALLAARRLGLGKFGSVEALREGGVCEDSRSWRCWRVVAFE